MKGAPQLLFMSKLFLPIALIAAAVTYSCASTAEIKSLGPSGKQIATGPTNPITFSEGAASSAEPQATEVYSTTALPPTRIEAVPTDRFLYGNRIYALNLIKDNVEVAQIESVTGRPDAQDADTNTPNIGTPIPAGSYWLGGLEYVEQPKELGGIWIGAVPQFVTNRTDLGIHYDPSFGVDPTNPDTDSGTKGCLAVTTEQTKAQLSEFVNTAQPTQLIVKGYIIQQ